MRVGWVVLVVGLVGTSTRASANDADELFQQGQALIAAGHVDEACTKFAASLQLDHQLGTALNLADCREQQHRYVDAYRLFASVEVEAIARGDKRAAFARQRQQKLGKQVVRITVQVDAPNTPGLTIRIADRTLGRDEWSTVQVADPGVVELAAAAPGFAAYQDRETAAAGAQLAFEVPALMPTGTTDTRAGAPGTGIATRVSPPSPAHSRMPFIVGGAGAAVIVASVAIAISARVSYNRLLDQAEPPADRDGQIDHLQRRADVGTVVGIVGVAALATGAVLFIRDRRHSVVVAPTSTATSVGLALSGSL